MGSSLLFLLLASLLLERRPQLAIAALASRVQALKDKLNTTYENIGNRTDALITRLSAVDARHNQMTQTQLNEISEIEQGVISVEGLVNQMTNGGPTLGGASPNTQHADQNGVVVNK